MNWFFGFIGVEVVVLAGCCVLSILFGGMPRTRG